MELITNFINIFLHLDIYLAQVIQTFGLWTYIILFIIIFCETGLVVTPFLPGDSLLFAAGAFAAQGSLHLSLLLLTIVVAAILGNMANYHIGYSLGPKVFKSTKNRFFKKEYLDKTEAFYEKHGGKTIIFARFMPIIRTFAPFVAGVGKMNYAYFSFYNITGCLAWVGLLVGGGYFFGNIPVVAHNFTLVIFAIIAISLLPAVIGFIRHRLATD